MYPRVRELLPDLEDEVREFYEGTRCETGWVASSCRSSAPRWSS
jgi:hypothetical protein